MASAPDRHSWMKHIAWPLVALAVVALIFMNGVGPAQEVELGPIKLKFSAEKARSVPQPPEKVAGKLAELTPAELDRLVRLGDGQAATCSLTGVTNIAHPIYKQDAQEFAKLESLGLAEHVFDDRVGTRPNEATADWCDEGQAQLVRLSEHGKQLRKYLMDLLTTSLTISRAN